MRNLHPSPFTRASTRRIDLYLTPIEMLVLELDLAIRDTTAIEDVLGDKVVLGVAVLVVQVHNLADARLHEGLAHSWHGNRVT